MKTLPPALAGCILATTVALARGDCEELKAISLPLTEDMTVTLSGNDQSCIIPEEEPGEGLVLDEFVIDGGSLTLSGPSTTTFANLRFTVMDGAGLIFDFDRTNFGPNFGYSREDSYGTFMLDVRGGGYAEFSGEMVATEVETYFSVFRNNGTLEFKSDAHFYDCGTNVFRTNYGKLRFRADATFERSIYLGIDNDGGTVRIAGDSVFNDTGRGFDGADGAAFSNTNDGIAIFDGFAVFEDNRSDGRGGAVYNTGKMKFYDKARFFYNWAEYDGGAVSNSGTLTFFGAVQMMGNSATDGGGLHVGNGGSVIFRRWTTIQDNEAGDTGGAIATDYLGEGSTIEFRKPTKVRITGNTASWEAGCDNIYLGENSVLIGYESDGDICDGS